MHRALFALRHDHGRSARDPDAVTATLAEHLGADDAAAVVEAVESGEALAVVRKEHEAVTSADPACGACRRSSPATTAPCSSGSWTATRARPPSERAHGRATIERVLDLLEWTDLNEFKATRIPR